MASISELSFIHPDAKIGENVEIGPFCFIDKNVKIGDGCVLFNNVTVIGNTTIGKNNKIHSGAVLGGCPQDLKYHGEDTKLVVGDENTIRECVTMNIGTEGGGGKTEIGSRNLFQCYVHIAHDCIVFDDCVLSAYCALAGHVHIHNFAILGGKTAVHQFVTIGQHAFVQATTAISIDVPPYMMVAGTPGKVRGLNLIGLRRKNITRESILALKVAHRLIYRSELNIKQALAEIHNSEEFEVEEVRELVQSLVESDKGKGRYLETLRENTSNVPENVTSINA